MEDQVRVIRILEYVGSRGWVEEALKMAAVPLNGTRRITGDTYINSALLGTFPEIMSQGKLPLELQLDLESCDDDE